MNLVIRDEDKMKVNVELDLVQDLVYIESKADQKVVKMSSKVKVNVHEAKTNFSKLLSRVEKGEEIIICKAGHPVARLNPMNEKPIERTPGSAKGQVTIAEDFDAPLPEPILKSFEQ